MTQHQAAAPACLILQSLHVHMLLLLMPLYQSARITNISASSKSLNFVWTGEKLYGTWCGHIRQYGLAAVQKSIKLLYTCRRRRRQAVCKQKSRTKRYQILLAASIFFFSRLPRIKSIYLSQNAAPEWAKRHITTRWGGQFWGAKSLKMQFILFFF